MTILDRVRLFLRTKHEHDFRLHRSYEGIRCVGYRAICRCGVDGGPVDISRWSVLRGRSQPMPQGIFLDWQAFEKAMASLDFHAGEQH